MAFIHELQHKTTCKMHVLCMSCKTFQLENYTDPQRVNSMPATFLPYF